MLSFHSLWCKTHTHNNFIHRPSANFIQFNNTATSFDNRKRKTEIASKLTQLLCTLQFDVYFGLLFLLLSSVALTDVCRSTSPTAGENQHGQKSTFGSLEMPLKSSASSNSSLANVKRSQLNVQMSLIKQHNKTYS